MSQTISDKALAKDGFKTVAQFKKQIAWLEKFQISWNRLEGQEEDRPKEYIDLCKKLIAWTKKNNLPYISADELKAELKAQMDCTIDGQF